MDLIRAGVVIEEAVIPFTNTMHELMEDKFGDINPLPQRTF